MGKVMWLFSRVHAGLVREDLTQSSVGKPWKTYQRSSGDLDSGTAFDILCDHGQMDSILSFPEPNKGAAWPVFWKTFTSSILFASSPGDSGCKYHSRKKLDACLACILLAGFVRTVVGHNRFHWLRALETPWKGHCPAGMKCLAFLKPQLS